MTSDKVPVTVLTGFLGAGKTTLLNHILTRQHGRRIAVIENEFGEIGIDHNLVINADEEIFEMNNGCICCTVRGDLIRILGNLMRRRDRFDHILVETTGMANPGPVAQTFFVDDEIREQLRLDGIVTLVDAKHIGLHLDDSQEAQEQIAFADLVLLNKTDLVSDAEVAGVEQRIRSMNALVDIHRTTNAEVKDLGALLDLGGFDLQRALAVKPTFLEPEYPFEWAGLYTLEEGDYILALNPGPDPSMKAAVLSVGDDAGIDSRVEEAVRRFAEPARVTRSGERLGGGLSELIVNDKQTSLFTVAIPKAGRYALFTQHLPAEFELRLNGPKGPMAALAEREFAPPHQHEDEVGSVGIRLDGALDMEKVYRWLGELLREKGVDIYRMKGILNLAGEDRRFVFQGVHMLFDGRPERAWGQQARHNEIVFIGRRLDRAELTQGLRECLT